MITALFTYPKEFTSLPELKSRSGQVVEVLGEYDPAHAAEDREVYGETLMRVKFPDGYLAEAFEAELSEVDA
ncbi:unnamed protein product [Sphagnum balticum]